jgi:DNA-directed RNA polymerase specialized sigma24 family protein
MDAYPEHFEHLAALSDGPAELAQAVALTEALNNTPAAQARMRSERQRVINELHAAGMSYTEMAPALGVKPERVSGIARGHSRSGGRRDAERDSPE